MTLKTFRVTNKTSGADLGSYQAETANGALNVMASEAGYSDYEAACLVSSDFDDLLVEETGYELSVREGEDWILVGEYGTLAAAEGAIDVARKSGDSRRYLVEGGDHFWAEH